MDKNCQSIYSEVGFVVHFCIIKSVILEDEGLKLFSSAKSVRTAISLMFLWFLSEKTIYNSALLQYYFHKWLQNIWQMSTEP